MIVRFEKPMILMNWEEPAKKLSQVLKKDLSRSAISRSLPGSFVTQVIVKFLRFRKLDNLYPLLAQPLKICYLPFPSTCDPNQS